MNYALSVVFKLSKVSNDDGKLNLCCVVGVEAGHVHLCWVAGNTV